MADTWHKSFASLWIVLFGIGLPSAAAETGPAKSASTLYPPAIIQRARANADSLDWGRAFREQLIEAAKPWREMSDEQLWGLMFSPTINRSWMVWSNGYCPACKEKVPMYNWKMDALGQPWKTQCPHCGQFFPTNDFEKFYRSGLDEHGIFQPVRADRSLLFNTEHPDPADPLHTFGVDDGEGYVEGDNRWRFIGAYLIYGQWKQAVLGGIRTLAAAYVLTGDTVYAHKAGILLDRVADLYPTFDFKKQGLVYEKLHLCNGYVSTWHDACEETRALTLTYDQVFDGMRQDPTLPQFLAKQARQYGLNNPKSTFVDIQQNIEDRILRDALTHGHKIKTNYPRDDIALTVIHLVLGTDENRKQADAILDRMLVRATAVDGVTGEKGLAGYGAIGPNSLVGLLETLSGMDPDFLPDLLKRYPKLYDSYRFHIDTRCLGRYYPLSGDTGQFAHPIDGYAGAGFLRPEDASAFSFYDGPLVPSAFSFLYKLYRITGDPAFVQVIYEANDYKVDGLPHDLFATDPEKVQQDIAEVIAREGTEPKLGSLNKAQWHLAILRSGQKENGRALWLDYDSGQNYHGHTDGLNLGLFACGLDLMPDFGYPPVQFGGWDSPRASWYRNTVSHNTALVDGRNQDRSAAGEVELWAIGKTLQAMRASCPGCYDIDRYERTALLIDGPRQADSCVIDVFRITGGRDHALFYGSHFGQFETSGLSLEPSGPYGHGEIMRNWQTDPSPAPGWQVDLDVDDLYKLLDPKANVHIRVTGLTPGAAVSTAEAWVVAGIFDSTRETWVPRIMVRRQAEEEPLASTFVHVVEPYRDTPGLAAIRRLPVLSEQKTLAGDGHAGVALDWTDGTRDLLIVADPKADPSPQRSLRIADPDNPSHSLTGDGELLMARWNPQGELERVVISRGRAVEAGEMQLAGDKAADLLEVAIRDGRPVVEAKSGDSQPSTAPAAPNP